MSRQKISLNNLSGPDSQDLSVRYPADRIRVSAWYCQNLSEVPACYLGITRGRVRPFYLPVLPLYGFTKLYTNPFLLIYLLPNFKLPVLVPFWGLNQKKTKFGFPQPTCAPRPGHEVDPRVLNYLDVDATVDTSFPSDCSDSGCSPRFGDIFERCSDDSMSS
jgi:hypothetical protein